MCGIAGILSLDDTPRACAAAIHLMTAAMLHRGPDDEGYLIASKQDAPPRVFRGDDTVAASNGSQRLPQDHIDTAYQQAGHLFFGHRRLAIIDLTPNGQQPMCTSDGRYWIVYNGEIYNHHQIAQQLQAEGTSFRSRTDTEVLLYAYRAWGHEMLDRLNGMFAFAIWDDQQKQLFCARDHVGIKPFYYTVQNDQFLFASDIKTLIASKMYEPAIDLEGVYHVMGYGVAPRPLTAFKDVKALRPGHWLRIDKSGQMEHGQYWRIPVGSQNPSMTEGEATDLLRSRLQQSVKRRLVADVPVGTFMSGGMDSTLVTALAAQLHPGIRAFTLGFADDRDDLDESAAARATAGMYDIDHCVEMVDVDSVLDDLEQVIHCYEEPYYSLSPNYIISRFVAGHAVTVVLNGLGGDELFGGYRYYRLTPYWDLLRRFEPLAKGLRYFGPRGRQIAAAAGVATIDRAHSVLHASLTDASRQALFRSPEVRHFNSVERLRQLYVPDDVQFADNFEALSYMDIMNYIGNHHTYRLDQFTMRFSLEGRVPFLDPDVIQAAFTIPTKLKVRGNTGKYVLRKVAENLVHPDSLRMPKKGFSLPMARWMRGPLRDLVRQKIDWLVQRELFEASVVREYLNSFESGRGDYRPVWQLVALEMWLEKFID